MTRISRLSCLSVLFAQAFLFITGCGFHLMGRGSGLPSHIKSIGVITFENKTSHFEVEQRITDALVNELLRRKGYKIVAGSGDADAVLSGSVVEFEAKPVEFDERSYATKVEIKVRAEVSFVDSSTGNVLWRNDNYLFQDQYEVEGTATEAGEAFFDQEIETVERIAKDFARTIVSALLEGF